MSKENLKEINELKAELNSLEAELNSLIDKKKITTLEVQEQLFKAPTDKEIIQMVTHYLSDDSNLDDAVNMCRAEGLDTTPEELREFVKEPVKKKTKKFYSALINGAYKKIEQNLKIFRNATIEPRPSPNANKKRNIDRDAQIVKDLQIYYDDDLPLKHNVKSYFNELADKHDISFRRIKQIAEENLPDNSSK